MPLSENEQKILNEIEKHLHESDPRLARSVSQTSVYRHALGSLKWSVTAFVVGLALMVGALRTHFLLSFVGFLVMLLASFGFERNLRMMGKAGVAHLSSAVRAANPNLRRRADEEAADEADEA
ncbi:MAG: DUF3040 domain-containing protein [Acidimicrobiales bacterium]